MKTRSMSGLSVALILGGWLAASLYALALYAEVAVDLAKRDLGAMVETGRVVYAAFRLLVAYVLARGLDATLRADALRAPREPSALGSASASPPADNPGV